MDPKGNPIVKLLEHVRIIPGAKHLLNRQDQFARSLAENVSAEEAKPKDTAPAALPILIFRDTTCVPIYEIDEDTLLLRHPEDNEPVTRIPIGQEESTGFFLSPKLSEAELFEGKALQSYRSALLDPLLKTLPYVLETYRTLESCYRQPAFRIMEPLGNPDQGYLFKFYCRAAFAGVSGQISCRVVFFEDKVYFSSPIMTRLKTATHQIFLLTENHAVEISDVETSE